MAMVKRKSTITPGRPSGREGPAPAHGAYEARVPGNNGEKPRGNRPHNRRLNRNRPDRPDRTALTAVRQDGDYLRIHYHIPSVAKYCARVIVTHAMDYVAAVRAILALHNPNVSDRTVGEVARNMEQAEEVQAAIRAELEIHGLDDQSKDSFVKEMWEWLRFGNNELKKKAAQILGRGFIAEKVVTGKPEQLPIAGLNDIVQSMLSSPGANETSTEIANETETVIPSVDSSATTAAVTPKDISNGRNNESPRKSPKPFFQRPRDPNKRIPDA